MKRVFKIYFDLSSGSLAMTNKSGNVNVDGDYYVDSSASHSGLLTAGVLTVSGDFTQKSQYSGSTSYTIPGFNYSLNTQISTNIKRPTIDIKFPTGDNYVTRNFQAIHQIGCSTCNTKAA